MKNSTVSALAWGGVLLAGALWGGGALVAQFVMVHGMSPQSLALARFACGLPLLWWWHLRQPAPSARAGRWGGLSWRERAMVAGTGVAMALNVSCWFAGIAALGAALPTVISVCCAPVIVSVVSMLRGYERPTGRLLAALLLASAGVALMVFPANGWVWPQHYLAGLAWSFASAGLHALVVLGNARMPSRVTAVTASAWGMTAAAGCMALLVLGQGLPTWPHGGPAWLGVAYTGVVTTSVAYLLFAWGARRLGPTAAGICTLTEPLVATLLAAGLLSEPLAPRQWLGAAGLGLAMLLLMRRA
ncbi:DMT family transporter [Variovorax terrae]|uniref:DMT family transporter n=1 Tax=Variovorax terrae TaxID=2923278 RepID=A0A9X2APR1_9BURK|nr:DMT family transporter [Variovorax terrae]